ncbi:hypothetical protein C8J56DRAFT_1057447 [Mycena floridula]|nr:hypothetical protein C8J56DRAFT_1057447 [Mycena floridula]
MRFSLIFGALASIAVAAALPNPEAVGSGIVKREEPKTTQTGPPPPVPQRAVVARAIAARHEAVGAPLVS